MKVCVGLVLLCVTIMVLTAAFYINPIMKLCQQTKLKKE